MNFTFQAKICISKNVYICINVCINIKLAILPHESSWIAVYLIFSRQDKALMRAIGDFVMKLVNAICGSRENTSGCI